ncbi:hypothetical protein HSBAA_34280 [Vreelandella sulfidaeris]|uniref:Uncharacterized protein n=1 Tax=Vreelandella sulfidaeris TaxID=115553 RepID=A0A455U7L8_9GAMM|nr:hypothetical protein HSBAA_34280 [Halomonas sulfidaeris]
MRIIGKNLPVNVGRYNIDRVIYDYYRDRDIAWEAFKAGLTDFRTDARAATPGRLAMIFPRMKRAW